MKKFLLFAVLFSALVPLAQTLDPARKIASVEKIIETFYVDPVDTGKVVDEGIRAMLKKLDPHSSYTNAEETKEVTEPLEGKFSGIGIQFQMLNDTLYVIQTIAGGPSERVGIQPGDRILVSNDSLISGVKRPNSSVMKLLRGPKGTVANLKVLRGKETIDFRVVRDDIPIYSVDASYMVDPEIGYIRLSRFAEDTPKEMYEAIEKLNKQGMKKLIIDLQDNSGGYLQSAMPRSSAPARTGSDVRHTMPPPHPPSSTAPFRFSSTSSAPRPAKSSRVLSRTTTAALSSDGAPSEKVSFSDRSRSPTALWCALQ